MKHSNKSKHSVKLSGQLKVYMWWPIFTGVLLLILTISMYFIDIAAGTVMSIFMFIYLIIAALMILYYRPAILHNMIEFASGYSQVQRSLIRELSIPYALLEDNCKVLWFNDAMIKLIDKNKDYKKSISAIFPEIIDNILPVGEQEKEIRLTYNNRDFRVELKKTSFDMILNNVTIIEANPNTSLIAMYMFDETDINRYIQKIKY